MIITKIIIGRPFRFLIINGSNNRGASLLSAAQARNSLAVLVNFLRYQIGRGRQGWADKKSGLGLGELLEKEVGERVAGTEASGKERYRLEARVAALLFGYLIREYTFRCHQAGTSSYD